MQFTLESGARNAIRSYGPEGIRVGATLVSERCIVSAAHLVVDWRPRCCAELVAEDLDAVLALGPRIVLLGTGGRQQLASRALRERVTDQGIGFEVMDLGAACRTYNVLLAEERAVVAALFTR